MIRAPLIGLSSCVTHRNGGDYHEVKNQYHDAVLTCTSGLALSVPSLGQKMDIQAYVDSLDGLVLTGSLSNVHPSRYGEMPTEKAEPFDEQRDEVTFQLLELSIAAGLPTLCICRGFQEAVVYFGGTLHPMVHEVSELNDHRRPDLPDLAGQFGLNHSVEVLEGYWADWLAKEGILPENCQIMINSLHLQGVKTMGPNLHIEARASDGLVEAFSAPNLPGFFWAAQFHPEWDAANVPQYRVIWEAFSRAAESRRDKRK